MKKMISTTILLTHSNHYIRIIANFLLKNDINEILQIQINTDGGKELMYAFEIREKHCTFGQWLNKINNFIVYIDELAYRCPNTRHLLHLLLHQFYNARWNPIFDI